MTPLRTVGLLVAVILAVLAYLWPFRSWPATAYGRSLASYILGIVFAIGAALLFPFGHGPYVGFFGAVMLAAWIGLGVLWLARRNPQIPNPQWVHQRWSVADWGLIVIVIASALATALN